MVSRIIKLLLLALSSSALVCLIIVFVGSTSLSSLTSLYFIKVSMDKKDLSKQYFITHIIGGLNQFPAVRSS